MPIYSESIPAPRWVLAIVVVSALVMLGGVLIVLAAGDSPALFRVLITLVLTASAIAMLVVARMFAVLRVEVTDEGVDFRFGRFGKMLRSDQIMHASPDRYPWLRYGGWGVRFSSGGDRAYSQAFERGSVVIDAADHHRYHVSSRHSAELADAINRVAAAESASS